MKPRFSITFSEPQADYLNKEAERLGISVAALVGRIVDSYREPRLQETLASVSRRAQDDYAKIREAKRREDIDEAKRHMDETGRYIAPGDNHHRDIEIYRRIKAGESGRAVADDVGLSSVHMRLSKMARIEREAEEYAKNRESITNSPLPIRLKNCLMHMGAKNFYELDGLSRRMLLKLPNMGADSITILEAFLEVKFPQYRLSP